MWSDIRSSMNPTVGPEYINIIVKTREKKRRWNVKRKVEGEEEGRRRRGR